MGPKKSKIQELIEKLKDQIDAPKMLNLKYLDQNFHMKKELECYKIKTKNEEESKKKDKENDNKKKQ